MTQGISSTAVTEFILTENATTSSLIDFPYSTSNYSSDDAADSDDMVLSLVQVHGILMVYAWMVFAGFGMLFPRYFKPAWPRSKLFGLQIWFPIHLTCMILALLITAAAFIVIFIEAEGWVTDLTGATAAHPPIGVCVMALVLINPMMAIFRCQPDHKYRFIFNICHFFVGLSAYVLAVVNIFLACYMSYLSLPSWTIGVMCGYIGFHVATEMVLALHMHRNAVYKRNSAEFDMIKMKTNEAVAGELVVEFKEDSKFKTTVLVIYLLGVLAFATAIAVQIGLATAHCC